jgi:hypothetical protein
MDVPLTLFGDASIIGRSIVLVDPSGTPVSCATITRTAPTILLGTQITTSRLNGIVFFEQQSTDVDALTSITLNLTSSDVAWWWSIVTMCSSAMPYDPFQSGGICSNTYSCAVGDLAGKHGNLTASQGSIVALYNDVRLPLSGLYAISQRFLKLVSDSGAVVCSPIVAIPARTAVVAFSGLNVGITQGSPWAPALLTINASLAGNLSISTFPSITSSFGENVCQLLDVYSPFKPNPCLGACLTGDGFRVCMSASITNFY